MPVSSRLVLPLALLVAPVLAVASACSGVDGLTIVPDGTGTASANATGQQLATLYGCAKCHGGDKGDFSGGSSPVAGTRAWAPNLTADMDTGIGSWTDDDITRAIRQGQDDQSAELCPTMPRFPTMADEEVKKIIAFLRSLPAVANQVDDSICPPLKPDPSDDDGGTMPGDDGGPTQGGTTGEDDAGSTQGGPTQGGPMGGVADGGIHLDGGFHFDGGPGPDAGGPVPDAGPPVDAGGPACGLTHLVVSQLRTRGPGGASDELVEIYNPTSAAVTLDATWTLQSRSTTSTTYSTRWHGTGGVVPAHGHYLIGGLAYTQAPAADATLTSGITDASSLVLRQNGTTVDALCYYVDAATQAAFDATFTCAGTPVSNAPHDNKSDATSNVDVALQRKPGGAAGNCDDTGDNAADFAAVSPAAPRSSKSAPTP